MHKIENRELKGLSPARNGCVLNNPNHDPLYPELHYVFCLGMKEEVFILTKKCYDETTRSINQNRKNDNFRMMDQALSFGDYISFKHDECNYIVDFEKGTNRGDTIYLDGKSLFVSLCVFNSDLSEVYTEHFGTMKFTKGNLAVLSDVPTPNVGLKCYIEFTLLGRKMIPEICKIVDVAVENQEFASSAPWNANNSYRFNEFDDDIQVEEPEEVKIGVISDKKGFITGLTSVFVADQLSKTIILPTHNKKYHSIGREAQCDLVYNEVLKCYIVFSIKPKPSCQYHTMLRKKSDSIEGIFYVDINVDKASTVNGFYKHDNFKLIADPYGFLDVARFSDTSDEGNGRKIYTVPIKDRLGKKNDFRTLQDLNIVTRFEVTSSGDNTEQLELINKFRNNKASLQAGGIVINEKTGLVCGHNFNGILFKLNGAHGYRNGAAIVFKAVRFHDPDITRPTFLIISHKPKKINPGMGDLCSFSNGKFKFKAKFNKKFGCYEALNTFGYVPCTVAPPDNSKLTTRSGEPIERIYEITAVENTDLPGQTVMMHGEFVKEVTVRDSNEYYNR